MYGHIKYQNMLQCLVPMDLFSVGDSEPVILVWQLYIGNVLFLFTSMYFYQILPLNVISGSFTGCKCGPGVPAAERCGCGFNCRCGDTCVGLGQCGSKWTSYLLIYLFIYCSIHLFEVRNTLTTSCPNRILAFYYYKDYDNAKLFLYSIHFFIDLFEMSNYGITSYFMARQTRNKTKIEQ